MNPGVERALDGLDASLADVDPREWPGIVVALAARLASLGGRLGIRPEVPAASPQDAPPSEAERARCLRPEVVAERLNLPLSRVYALLRTRRLPGFKEGKYWLVPETALAQHLSQRVNSVALRGASAPAHRPQPMAGRGRHLGPAD